MNAIELTMPNQSQCNRVKYIYTVTSQKIDIDVHNNLDNVEDHVHLNIYFGSLSFMNYKELPSMTQFELVSNLGGTLGIF